MLQVAAAQAAKTPTKSGKGTVSTNVADYKNKDLRAAFANSTVTTSVLVELIANRKTVLGAHHADHEKLGMTEEQLTQAHAVLDSKRLTMVNERWKPRLFEHQVCILLLLLLLLPSSSSRL
jgi:hypothetical protein